MEGFNDFQLAQIRAIITEVVSSKEKPQDIFEPEMVTVKEAAALLKKSVPYVWKLIKKDILPAYKEDDMVTKVSRSILKTI